MDGPGKNALGSAMFDFLEAELDKAGDGPVLITGAGGVFSAGLNLREIASLDQLGMSAFLRRLDRVAARLHDHPGPTVAAVNGHAIAGGCVIALCCDHIVATTDEKARIGLNEVALGLVFPPVIWRIVRQRIPDDARRTVLLGGDLFDTQTAGALGLTDALSDDPLADGRARLATLAERPAAAYAEVKSLLLEGITDVDETEWAAWADHHVPAWTSGELKARIEKLLGG